MTYERAFYPCECGDLTHLAALALDPENDWGTTDLSMVVPWMPLWWRWRQAWECLRGQPASVAFVCLDSATAARLRDDLNTWIEQKAAQHDDR